MFFYLWNTSNITGLCGLISFRLFALWSKRDMKLRGLEKHTAAPQNIWFSSLCGKHANSLNTVLYSYFVFPDHLLLIWQFWGYYGCKAPAETMIIPCNSKQTYQARLAPSGGSSGKRPSFKTAVVRTPYFLKPSHLDRNLYSPGPLHVRQAVTRAAPPPSHLKTLHIMPTAETSRFGENVPVCPGFVHGMQQTFV